MSNDQFRIEMNMNTIFKLSDINKHTQAHLSKVYAALGSGVLFSLFSGFITAQGIVGLTTLFLVFLATIVGEIWTIFTKNHERAKQLKCSTFYSWAFLMGSSFGIILANVEGNDKRDLLEISINAFIFSIAIFSCFTVFALATVRRHIIFAASIILTLVLSLVSLFVFNYHLHACLGLIIGVLYVIVDTQIIIKRTECGIYDTFTDAKQLFVDLFKIFIEIVKILGEDKKKKKNN